MFLFVQDPGEDSWGQTKGRIGPFGGGSEPQTDPLQGELKDDQGFLFVHTHTHTHQTQINITGT